MKTIDVLLAILVAVIWGMGFIVAKAAMSHFSPILLMALRFTLTAFCLLWFFRPPPGLFKQLFWISLVSAALQYSLTFNGVSGIDASTAALLVQLEVPFGLLLAWLVLGDRISLKQGCGIAISFTGAILIIGEPRLSGDLIYAFMVIGGAFTWAVGQIMIKQLGNLGGFRLISGVSLFAAPQLYIASYLFAVRRPTAIHRLLFIRKRPDRPDRNCLGRRLGCGRLSRPGHDRARLRRLVSPARPLQRQPGDAILAAIAGEFCFRRHLLPWRIADC
jgi:O-acetylserine/cysteine efflux transporter